VETDIVTPEHNDNLAVTLARYDNHSDDKITNNTSPGIGQTVLELSCNAEKQARWLSPRQVQ